MRNMQTWASMSVSIVVEGRLWGWCRVIIATPRSVSFQVRTACELLGRVLSLQIETREAHLRHARMLEIRQRIVQLLGAIADQDSVRLGLRALPDIFTDFVGAAGAAVVSSTGCDTYGHTPPQARIMALVGWLTARGDAEVFHTDNAGRDIPHLAGLADMASGILAVSISELHPHYLIWFKPQQSQVVHWAGRPEKASPRAAR